MDPRKERIPDDEWEVIVHNVPIVSVDLVVLCNDGVVLGKRQNEPAKGEWFVPGGRVKKHESLTDAVHRIAQTELGIEVEIIERLGVYEHFYETSDVVKSSGKHYLANGFVVRALDSKFDVDYQHGEVRIFTQPPNNIHQYVQYYLDDSTSW